MTDIIYSYNNKPKKEIVDLYRYFELDKHLGEDIACYFTDDSRVIENRQSVYKNLTCVKGAFECFDSISSKMSDLFYAFEMAGIGIAGDSNEVMLNSVCAVNSYVSFIELAYRELRHLELWADGLCDFYKFIAKEKESEHFKRLKKNSEAGQVNIRNIKSVTIGINLDANLKVLESGLVSINSTPYRSANFIDKLLSSSFNEPTDFECLCPLSEMGKALKREEIATVNFKLNKALDKLLSKNIKSIRNDTKEYLSEVCRQLTGFKKDLSFYLSAIRFFENVRHIGLPACMPKPSEDRYYIKDLYNYRIANIKGASQTVPSSFEFDEKGKIYILTGANSGGKTVFLEALITAQLLFQLGLPVFSQDAILCPFEDLHIYFGNTVNADTNIYGRFENEIRWFSEHINNSNEKELFVMDELFSGTSSFEAADIAMSALLKIKAKQGYAIFSTHLHETAKCIEENCNKPEYFGFDNLSVKTDGDRSLYTIVRGSPESYESKAVAIARKYGLYN